MSVSLTPFYLAPIAPVVRRVPRNVPPSGQLDVLLEMLSTLATLTNEGQRQTMARIVGIIGDHASRGRQLGRHNHEALMATVNRLARASQHSWPDVESFQAAGENVIKLLKASS